MDNNGSLMCFVPFKLNKHKQTLRTYQYGLNTFLPLEQPQITELCILDLKKSPIKILVHGDVITSHSFYRLLTSSHNPDSPNFSTVHLSCEQTLQRCFIILRTAISKNQLEQRFVILGILQLVIAFKYEHWLGN